MIGKEEVHFCRCFSFRRELENDTYAIDYELFTCVGDVFGGRNETRRSNRN